MEMLVITKNQYQKWLYGQQSVFAKVKKNPLKHMQTVTATMKKNDSIVHKKPIQMFKKHIQTSHNTDMMTRMVHHYCLFAMTLIQPLVKMIKHQQLIQLNQLILGLCNRYGVCLDALSHRFQYQVCLHTSLPPLSHSAWKPYRNTSGNYSIL